MGKDRREFSIIPNGAIILKVKNDFFFSRFFFLANSHNRFQAFLRVRGVKLVDVAPGALDVLQEEREGSVI